MEIDPIQKTIDESSNNVEIDAYNVLANTDWKEIIENSNFTDPVEKKLRETDILAINYFYPGFKKTNTNRTIFLAECKYINDKVVFWFKDKKIEKAKALVRNNYVFSMTPVEQCPLGISVNGLISHHYIENNKVAKKWDYVKEKPNEKDRKDIIGLAMNQLKNALYFFSHNQYNTRCIIFPILIINDYKNVYKVEENGKYSAIKERFQIETEYSMKIDDHGVENFYQLIDIISVKELKVFIDFFSKTTLKTINDKIIFDYSAEQWKVNTKKNSPAAPWR